MTQPLESLAEVMGRNPLFSHDENAKPIRRERTCECGKRFTQTLLSERFLSMCERQGRRCIDLVTQQVPGFFVPVHCPHCERIDLGHAARLADSRALPDAPFGERDAA